MQGWKAKVFYNRYGEAIHKFHVKERRRTVTKLLAESMTETEIAKQLGVCRDIRHSDVFMN